MTNSLIGEGVVIFFVDWECIAICDVCVIMSDDCFRIVNIFDGFKYFLVDFSWFYDGIWFFRANIKGVFCGESIVCDSGDGAVFNATIIDRGFGIASGDVCIGVGAAVIIFVIFYRNLVRNLFLWIMFGWVGSCSLVTNAMFSFGLLELLVCIAHCFDFGWSSWWFWVAVGGGRFSGESMIAYVVLVL